MAKCVHCDDHVELCEKIASLITKLDDAVVVANASGIKINGKASTSNMKWVIGIFIIVSMAVVGFLYNGQTELAKQIRIGFREITYEMKDMSNQITRQGVQLEEHMNNQETLGTQYQRDRLKWESDRKEYEKKLHK